MKVFYTGNAYSEERGKLISKYYEITSDRSLRRIDLPSIETALSKGEAVLIVPASLTQVKKINALLNNLKNKNL